MDLFYCILPFLLLQELTKYRHAKCYIHKEITMLLNRFDRGRDKERYPCIDKDKMRVKYLHLLEMVLTFFFVILV